MKRKIILLSLALLTMRISVPAQAIDNLQLLLSLADSSVSSIAKEISRENNYFLITVNPAEYNMLSERARFAFARAGINVTDDSSAANVIRYSIENARIEYPDVFRDGWFGDYLIERKGELSGYFLIETNGATNLAKSFALSKTDTVEYNKIKQYELASLPFTKGDIPAEPFFSSLWEPVIAVAAVVVTVVLLFTTRTK